MSEPEQTETFQQRAERIIRERAVQFSSVTIDPLDQTKRPKRFNNGCPNGRCEHRAWVHSTTRDQMEDPDDDQCARCYDCSYEASIEDDATA